MKRSNELEGETSTNSTTINKKPKSNLQWLTGYRQKISTLDTDRSLNVSLSYGYENGSLKRTLVHIRVYTKNYPTSDGFSFTPEELDYVVSNMRTAMVQSDFKCSKKFGSRNIILKTSEENDIKQLSFGTRRDRFASIRTFPMTTVELLIPVLERMSYICNNSGTNLGETIFDNIFSSMIFLKIEKDETKYDLKRDELLNNEKKLGDEVEDAFDFFDREIMDGVYRNCSAFGINKTVLTQASIDTAKKAVKTFLTNKFYLKNSFLQYQKIATLNLARNLMK